MIEIPKIPPERPVLIAGPTASGKSALALEIAEAQARPIVNADALQVYACWNVLSARPGADDLRRAPHHLYGHVAHDDAYSVGRWLRALAPYLAAHPAPVIVGGTGLYFRALTEGLAEVPATPPRIRAEADQLMAQRGPAALLKALDAATVSRIDTLNPMRVQRAWEVARATGRGLAAWQDATPPPLLPIDSAECLLLEAEREWLLERITRRFDIMIAGGALAEAEEMLPHWDHALPSAKAIGAPELMAYLKGHCTLEAAREAAVISTRQYAKRQRTWFRARMGAWRKIALPA